MSSHFNYLAKVHERTQLHFASLVRTIAGTNEEFIRAFSVRAGVPQWIVRLTLQRCIARDIRCDLQRNEVSTRLMAAGVPVRLEFKPGSIKDAATFARWIQLQARKLAAIDRSQLVRDELRSREHARAMAKLRKADRAEIITLADKTQGKPTIQVGGAS